MHDVPPLRAPTPPRRWLRFSLREILLATVAICAVVAVFARHGPYRPTQFFLTLDEQRLLRSIDKGFAVGRGIAGQSGEIVTGPGQSTRSLDWTFTAPSYDILCKQVMPPLRAKIQRLLVDSNCEITGRSLAGEGVIPSPPPGGSTLEIVREFSFTYKVGRTRGVIRVWAMEMGEGKTRLIMVTDEW
jgi:hypothetical protein